MFACNVCLAVLLGICYQAASNRFLDHSSRNHLARQGVNEDPVHTEAKVEILENTSIKHTHTDECLCAIGEFWHWRIRQCVKQGSWGYECGFFPGEHHRFVCMDGLQCKKVVGTTVTYQHDGAVPASCRHCEASDKCLKGEERQQEECLRENKLSGEAFAKVRVTLTADVISLLDQKASLTGRASKSNRNVTVDGEPVVGVGEGEASVTIEEVKQELGLKVKRVGPVLAAKIVGKGDKMAFERAYAKALAAALEALKASGADAAAAAAAKKAAMEGKMDSDADETEKAAWEEESRESEGEGAEAEGAKAEDSEGAAEGDESAGQDEAASAPAAGADEEAAGAGTEEASGEEGTGEAQTAGEDEAAGAGTEKAAGEDEAKGAEKEKASGEDEAKGAGKEKASGEDEAKGAGKEKAAGEDGAKGAGKEKAASKEAAKAQSAEAKAAGSSVKDLVKEVTSKNPQEQVATELDVAETPTEGPVPRKVPEDDFKDQFP